MTRRSTLVLLLASLVLPAVADAQQPAPTLKQSGKAAMIEVAAAALKFEPASIPGFRPGMEIATLSGDFTKPEAYTLRLRFPAGYAFPGHWHPQLENLTVVSGTFYLGSGEKTDETALKKYVAGDYLQIPGNSPHFGRVDGETVVQLHGIGPFAITVTEQIEGAVK